MGSRAIGRNGRGRCSATIALRRQLQRAIADLDAKAPVDDVCLHEVRKELKRARATLRLLRDSIGEMDYRRANRRLRDAARPLARVRDTKMLLGAVERLCGDTKKGPRQKELASLEQGLRGERQRARGQLKRSAALRRARRSVASVLSDSRPWPAATDASLRRGVERVYRKGRKTFARSEAQKREEALHESRKQTKYLAKALEVLAAAGGGRRIAKPVKRAEAIAHALGEEHDLAMLRKKLVARSRLGSDRRALLTQIDHQRRKLQRKAAKHGRRLYRRKPKAFVDALDLPGRLIEGDTAR